MQNLVLMTYTLRGLELEVKRGTANLLLQGGAPRHLQFEEILSIDLKRLVVLAITRGLRSGMADYS